MVSSRARKSQKSVTVQPFKSGFDRYPQYPLGFQSRDLEDSKLGAAGSYAYISEVANCLASIVGGIQSLPWNITRYKTGIRREGKQPVQGEILASNNDLQTRHPLQRAIKRFQRRNNFDLLGVIAFDYTLYGTVAFEVAVNDFGWNPKLEWLNPLGIQVFSPSGKIDFIQFGWNNNYITYKPEELSYLHNRDVFDDFIGRPQVLAALDKINILRNMDRFLRDYFNNNARPSLIVRPPEEGSYSNADFENTKRDLQDSFKGVGNQYSTWVLQKYVDVMPLEQPDLVKNNVLSKEQSDAVYEKFSVPRALRGNTGATAYKDGDETTRRFFLDAIMPLAEIIQGYINVEFMPHYDIEASQEIFEFDTSAFDLVTAADQLEAQVVNSQVSGGYLPLAEAQRIQERPVDPLLKNRYMWRGLPMTIIQVDKLIEAEITAAQAPPMGAPPPVPSDGGLGVGSPLGPREGEFMQRRLEEPKKSIKQKFTQEEVNYTTNSTKFNEADVNRDEEGQFAEEGGGDGTTEETSLIGTTFLSPDEVRVQNELPENVVSKQQEFLWNKNLERQERESVEAWTRVASGSFQDYGRGEPIEGELEKERFKDFENALDKAPVYNGISWRGVNSPESTDNVLADFKSKIGDTLTFDTFSSASASVGVAGNFSRGFGPTSVLFETHSSQGKYINSAAKPIGSRNEFELIFQPQSEFVIRDTYLGAYNDEDGRQREAIFVILEDAA